MKKAFIIVMMILFLSGCSQSKSLNKMLDVSKMTLDEIEKYANSNKLKLEIKEEHNDDVPKDTIISQSIIKDTVINQGDVLTIVTSLGPKPLSFYKDNNIDELGNVPIMMYHGIVNKASDDTLYTGGNVDRDGYHRTTEAFKNDLEMYYQSNYRMIRLDDYINGNIDVEFGKSPIILTFDDGHINNINILGLDSNQNLIIDPNSAVGILESFKNKYPDFNVTATFFLNSGLFGQPIYNKQILKWLVDNGYDIGNHTKNHANLKDADISKTQSEIAYMYKLFDELIPNKYVHIISLPFGLPGNRSHPNLPYILKGIWDGYSYRTNGVLQVGWDAECSPFHKKFDPTFLMRIRAWDNDGIDFDMQMVFETLEKTKFISDGNINTIVIPNNDNLNINIKDKKIIKY